MSTPLHEDLGDLIIRFQAAIDQFLDRKDFRVDPRRMPRFHGPRDFLRAAIEPPRQMHQTWAAAVPEAKERLQTMISLGSEVIKLAPDNRYIVGPVNDVVRLASEEQTQIGSITERAGETAFLLMFPQMIAFAKRQDARRKAISAARESLTAYYLMQMPTRDPDESE